MKEPVLIIMAAGMGSRYGGLKQIDPVTQEGEIIMDFSLYDAMMAGFKKAIFVIKEEMADDFRSLIEDRAGKYLETEFAFQKLDDLPYGYSVPDCRVKPWGTAHAVMACREMVREPFTVINADDYYGPAFHSIFDYLSKEQDDNSYNCAMVSYELKNTITENGHVARGICDVSKERYLRHIIERKQIMRVDGDICYAENDGKTWVPLPEDTPVSMNFWGYSRGMMHEIVSRFPDFLDKALAEDPEKAEYLLPEVTDQMIKEGRATVMSSSKDKWHGVTYKEDKEAVMASLQSLKDKGLYPDKLLEVGTAVSNAYVKTRAGGEKPRPQ